MNTISKLTAASVLSLGLFIAQSCVQDDDYSTPSLECPAKLQANITIKDLVEKADAKSLNVDENGLITDDLIVEGIVNTSDESGNLSNTISFQDKAEGATAGIQIELAERPVYGFYPIGSTVQVKLKGLKVAYDRGTIRIGTKLTGAQATTYDLDRMPKELRIKTFVKYCDPVQTIKPKEVNSIAEALKPENLNTLVTIKNVQFKSPETDATYYPAGATSTAANVRLIDKNGRETDLRTSSYANFKETKLPTTSGSITVLISRYNTSYQVFIRDTKDVNFDQARFGEDEQPTEPTPGEGNNTEAANLLFKGADFNNWSDLLGSLNSFGLTKDTYATSGVGLGRDNSNALQLKGTPSKNDYVFTAVVNNTVPAAPKKITFYVKGTSSKSLSLNVYQPNTDVRYVAYNIGNLSNTNVTLKAAEGNQYTGVIDTKGEWVLVTLDLTGVNLQKTAGQDIFALKVGSGAAYDLVVDNIKID